MLLGARTADVIGYGAPPLIPSRNKTIGDAEAADIHVKVWRSHWEKNMALRELLGVFTQWWDVFLSRICFSTGDGKNPAPLMGVRKGNVSQ